MADEPVAALCGCTDLQALHDRSFGDYMRCVECGTYYDTDGSRL
ncbi:hypothetical protein [Prescottella equi]|nr:hypothetical protein [Prescottella equi]